jgi:hypothetical protein
LARHTRGRPLRRHCIPAPRREQGRATSPWLGFNDRASSANGVVGAATLWERSWFGGRAAFVGSIGAACVSLSNLNFNNIASSAIGV